MLDVAASSAAAISPPWSSKSIPLLAIAPARLALARLCALQQHWDEAVEWFARARTVLDEQGARPLRAIVDFDEALMYLRRAAPGDRERAAPLLAAALKQFHALEMTGWIRRAEKLRLRQAP